MEPKGDRLGIGSYGIVYKCHNNRGEKCALKRNVLETDTDFIGVIRELDICYKLRNHPNIVSLSTVAFGNPFQEKKCLSPLQKAGFKKHKDDDVFFIFPEASCDLCDYIYDKETPDFEIYKNFMIDILLGVSYMHRCGFVHRDLKPSNILIFNIEGGDYPVAQLCDFGLSKPYTKQGAQTPDVITTWYRAPELLKPSILGSYDYKVDVWSIAAIFYEMVSKKTLVSTNRNNNKVILSTLLKKFYLHLSEEEKKDIAQTFPELIKALPKKLLTIEESIGLSKKGIETFNETPGSFQEFLLLLMKMFSFDPKTRYSVEECIKDPFFSFAKEYIHETNLVELVPKEKPMVLFHCMERKWVAKFTTMLFNERKKDPVKSWYGHRVLFQALSLMDRYLFWLNQNKLNRFEKSTDTHGLFFDENDTLLRFMACLYICIKYFTTLKIVTSFESIFATYIQVKNFKPIVKEFERELLTSVVKYDIYHPTLYEMADEKGDILSEEDIRGLVILYTRQSTFHGMLPSKILSIYQTHLKTKPITELVLPIDFGEFL
jgi:serine/threonine protein kinase